VAAKWTEPAAPQPTLLGPRLEQALRVVSKPAVCALATPLDGALTDGMHTYGAHALALRLAAPRRRTANPGRLGREKRPDCRLELMASRGKAKHLAPRLQLTCTRAADSSSHGGEQIRVRLEAPAARPSRACTAF